MKKSISIVLAVYNGERFLRDQLDSILNQTEVQICEIIIVNDGSQDDSLRIIESYRDDSDLIKIIDNKINSGVNQAFKTGAQLASGNYIAFSDQDDIWLVNRLSNSLKKLNEIEVDHLPCLVFSDLEVIDEFNNILYPSFWKLHKIKPKKNSFYTLLYGNMGTGCTFLINNTMKDYLLKMPIETYLYDHWLILVASAFGKWSFINRPLIRYRMHLNSVTDKSKVTLKKVIQNMLEASFNSKTNFLLSQLDQANLFKKSFYYELAESDQKKLLYFLGLISASGFKRKINSKFRFFLNKII